MRRGGKNYNELVDGPLADGVTEVSKSTSTSTSRRKYRLSLERESSEFGGDGPVEVGLPLAWPNLAVRDYVTCETDTAYRCTKGNMLGPSA